MSKRQNSIEKSIFDLANSVKVGFENLISWQDKIGDQLDALEADQKRKLDDIDKNPWALFETDDIGEKSEPTDEEWRRTKKASGLTVPEPTDELPPVLPCPDDLEEHRKADYHQGDENCPVAVRRQQPEMTDEEWRAVYREAHPSQHLHMDPCFYENAVAVTLAKQVVAERKRADEYRDTCSARVKDLVEATKERETLEGWAKSGAILVTLWEERFKEATERNALLEGLLREACDPHKTRATCFLLKEAFGDDA